jgi:3-methylcrotonyl-CoA carboxylase alpha subunit
MEAVRTGSFAVRLDDEDHRVVVQPDGTALVDGTAAVRVMPEGDDTWRVDEGGRTLRVFVTGTVDRRQVFVNGEVYEFEAGLDDARRGAARHAADLLSAPMPARVSEILVTIGQAVQRGDVVVKLEAMKMEMAVRAPRDGTVRTIACRVGELVQPGVGLVELS